MNGLADVEALGAWLDSRESKATTVMKLGLRGTVSLSAGARLDDLLDEIGLKYALLDSWDGRADLVRSPDDDDLVNLEVSGYVRETLDQLIAEAVGPGPAAIQANEALSLLYRLAR